MTAEAKTFRTTDAREFTFLFDIDGLIAVEDCANGVTGTANLGQVIAGAANSRVGYLIALAYGGLKARHPALTRADVWALIQSDGDALGAAMWPALFAAMPEAKGGDENPRKAASGTGGRSSLPGAKRASPRKGSASKPRGG